MARRLLLQPADYLDCIVVPAPRHPFGVGIGNFKEYIGNYDSSVLGRDAHNTIVRCYSELGLHGLAAFIALYLSAFTQLKRIRKKVAVTAVEYEINLYVFAISALC